MTTKIFHEIIKEDIEAVSVNDYRWRDKWTVERTQILAEKVEKEINNLYYPFELSSETIRVLEILKINLSKVKL